MKTYGSIKFSTVDAPASVKALGICENYNYKSSNQVFEIMDETALAGIVLHGAKGEISFSVTPGAGVTALNPRAGSEITVTGISTGKVIVPSVSAKWTRGQPMTMDVTATHYPGVSATGSGSVTPGSITLDRTGGALVLPTDKVWFSVVGLASPVAGIVQSCSISEAVQVQEEADPDGVIVALALYGYKANVTMEFLSTVALTDASLAAGESLDAFGGFTITGSEEKLSKNGARTISVEGILLP